MRNSEDWDLVIKPKNKLLDVNFQELWAYKDLILLFVKRDFVAQYKQTILGPLWHIIQPLLTTFLFVIIFGRIANLGTDGSPMPLFYLSGIITWNFFSGCLLNTSNTFVSNAGIFGKIYFPRLVVPISIVISTAIRFAIQLALFLLFFAYYFFTKDTTITITSAILLVPFLILIMALLGLAIGIIVSSLSTKYRDFSMFLGFGVQLLMYLTPVIYPAIVWKEYQWVMDLNPLTGIIESFRYAMMGTGELNINSIIYSFVFALITFFFGTILFSKTEKTFMDTV